jgi:hypothetical protein
MNKSKTLKFLVISNPNNPCLRVYNLCWIPYETVMVFRIRYAASSLKKSIFLTLLETVMMCNVFHSGNN